MKKVTVQNHQFIKYDIPDTFQKINKLWNVEKNEFPGPQPISIERKHFTNLKNKKYMSLQNNIEEELFKNIKNKNFNLVQKIITKIEYNIYFLDFEKKKIILDKNNIYGNLLIEKKMDIKEENILLEEKMNDENNINLTKIHNGYCTCNNMEQ